MKVKFAQPCLTLCNTMDCIVHGILQVRTLEWVAFIFSRGSSPPRVRTQVSHIAGAFFTSWTTREAFRYLNFQVKTLSFLFQFYWIIIRFISPIDLYFLWKKFFSTFFVPKFIIKFYKWLMGKHSVVESQGLYITIKCR